MTQSTRATSSGFEVVQELRDEYGLFAKITQKNSDGTISFTIGKEFERNGRTEQTIYLNRRHVPLLRAMLDKLEQALELAEDKARAARRERT